jgi:hypothetical protein
MTKPIRYQSMLSVVGAFGILAMAVSQKISARPTVDPTPYHARIQAIASQPVADSAVWRVEDLPDEGLKDAFRANVFLKQSFQNKVTGERVSFSLIQCRDVRDLVRHYPSICYPARAMVQSMRRPIDWTVDGLSMHATEYLFESNDFRQANATDVYHFIVLPNGSTTGDPGIMKKQMPLQNRFYGAAQVQIVFSGTAIEEGRRLAIVDEMIRMHRPIFDAILGGHVQ